MNDFGGNLRQARERRGISLRQLAATTKISPVALEALERNDIAKLPGGIFSRAFVRSYAIEVGLDADATVKEFLEQFHDVLSAPNAPRAPAPEEEAAFEGQQRVASVVLKLLLISVPVVGAILYFTLRTRPAPAVVAAPVQQVSAAPPVPAPSPAAVPAAAVVSAPPPSDVAAETTMWLEIRPTAVCWITLTVDGERVLSREVQAGEIVARAVRESAVIDVGDAGAFAFSIDGRPGRSLGGTGKVTKARITRETMASFLLK